ncbi:MAG: hypothetical protein GX096_12160 [Clostridiales bacterium]|nr:hypothetical protein [Clostridiales bacterium]
MKKRILALLLALLVSTCSIPMVPTAMAAPTDDPSISLFYTMISSIHGTCYIENGLVVLASTVNSAGKATYAKATVLLQKKTGLGWEDVKSWSETGTTKATVMKTYTAESGTFYRAKITGYVSNGSNSETDTITTKAVSL